VLLERSAWADARHHEQLRRMHYTRGEDDFVPGTQSIVAASTLDSDACSTFLIVEEDLHRLCHWIDRQRRARLYRLLEKTVLRRRAGLKLWVDGERLHEH
jgi:hypothetical protein